MGGVSSEGVIEGREPPETGRRGCRVGLVGGGRTSTSHTGRRKGRKVWSTSGVRFGPPDPAGEVPPSDGHGDVVYDSPSVHPDEERSDTKVFFTGRSSWGDSQTSDLRIRGRQRCPPYRTRPSTKERSQSDETSMVLSDGWVTVSV